jgi:transposase
LKKERKYYVEQRVALMNRVQVTRYKDEQKRHLKLIEQMDKMIETVEDKIKNTLHADESLKTNYALLISITGIGFVNAVNTIVNTENFTSFKMARQYASYVGAAPHSKTSGKSVRWKPKPSKYCDLCAKADLSQAAQSAIEYDQEMNRFYKRKTKYSNNPDTIRKTMNAVKFKLIQRMFAVVRRGTPFEQMMA